MYSRVTLLEIDTVRIDIDEAVARFREEVVPGLKEQDGYGGCVVLTTPEGKAYIVGSAEDWGRAAIAAGDHPGPATAAAKLTAAFYTGEGGH